MVMTKAHKIRLRKTLNQIKTKAGKAIEFEVFVDGKSGQKQNVKGVNVTGDFAVIKLVEKIYRDSFGIAHIPSGVIFGTYQKAGEAKSEIKKLAGMKKKWSGGGKVPEDFKLSVSSLLAGMPEDPVTDLKLPSAPSKFDVLGMNRKEPVNKKVWDYVAKEQQGRKKDILKRVEKAGGIPKDMSSMSNDMYFEFIYKDMETLTTESYAYFAHRAHVYSKSSDKFIDPGDRRKWVKIAGEPTYDYVYGGPKDRMF